MLDMCCTLLWSDESGRINRCSEMNNKQKQHLKPEDKEMENMKDMNETMVNELNP